MRIPSYYSIWLKIIKLYVFMDQANDLVKTLDHLYESGYMGFKNI